jgi:hypothetical protein
VDRQAEPTFTFRAVRIPVTAVRITSFETALRHRFVAVVLELHHLHLQLLCSESGLSLITVALVEIGHSSPGHARAVELIGLNC